MNDESVLPDEQPASDVAAAMEPASGWARLDELDPSPEQSDDDRLKGLPPPPMFG